MYTDSSPPLSAESKLHPPYGHGQLTRGLVRLRGRFLVLVQHVQVRFHFRFWVGHVRSPVSANAAAGRPRRRWSVGCDCCSIQAGMALLACERDRGGQCVVVREVLLMPKRTSDGVRLPMRFNLGCDEPSLGRHVLSLGRLVLFVGRDELFVSESRIPVPREGGGVIEWTRLIFSFLDWRVSQSPNEWDHTG